MWLYCPARSPLPRNVLVGFYSIPVTVPTTARVSQAACGTFVFSAPWVACERFVVSVTVV